MDIKHVYKSISWSDNGPEELLSTEAKARLCPLSHNREWNCLGEGCALWITTSRGDIVERGRAVADIYADPFAGEWRLCSGFELPDDWGLVRPSNKDLKAGAGETAKNQEIVVERLVGEGNETYRGHCGLIRG